MNLGEKPSTFSGWFTKLDTDNDGVITKTEWLDAWDKDVVAFEPQSVKNEPTAPLAVDSFKDPGLRNGSPLLPRLHEHGSTYDGERTRPTMTPDTNPV